MVRSGRTVLGAVGWSAIESWGSAVFSVVIMVVLARLLEPRAFGIVAMAGVYIVFVQIFVDQGLGSALVQRRDLARAHLDTAFWIGVVTSLVLVGVSVIMAPWVAKFFGEPRLAAVVRWLSLGLFINALSGTQRAILQRNLAFRDLAIRSMIGTVAGGIVGVTAAVGGLGVWSLVIQSLTGNAVSTMVLWKVSDWRPSFRISLPHFRELVGFSASVLGGDLLNFVNQRSDNLIIGAVLGPVALGYYTVAFALIRKLVWLLTGVVTKVAFPAFARLQHDVERMRSAFFAATRYTSLIAFPAFLGITLVAPELIRGIYGPKWEHSIPVMQVLAVIGILQSVYRFNGSVILSTGKASWRMGLSALNAVTNVIAFAIAVRWGIVAVATAYVVRGYVMSPIPVWMIRRVIGIDLREYVRQYVLPIVASAAMAAAVLILKSLVGAWLRPTVALGAYVVTGALVYILTIHFTSPDTWREMLRSIRTSIPVGSPQPTNAA